MTLGAPPKSIGIRLDRGSSSSFEASDTFPRYRFTTEYAVTTNPESVEHTGVEGSSTPSYLRNLQIPHTAPGPSQTPNSRPYELSSSHTDDSPPSRSKASTPTTPARYSAYTTPPDFDEETSLESEERGRRRTRLECIIPPRSRKISKKSIERRTGYSNGASGSSDGETFLTSESPSPTNSEKEAQDLILEPSPTEFVRGFSEVLSDQASPASPAAGVPFPHEHGSSSSMLNKRSQDLNRLSMMDAIHFQHHRDTFAILDLPKNKPLPSSPPEFTNLPYPVLKRLDKFLDHESRLALRLTCRWLSNSITEAHPLRFPAVARLPAEMIHEIISYLSPFDFNSARHTCRTWMRISLDKNLLARMFRKAGWWTSVEKEMRGYLAQSGADEDDFPAVWHLSSLLARECALTAYWTGKGQSQVEWWNRRVASYCQIDGTVEEELPEKPRPSPFEQVLETDFSALKDARTHGNAVPTYAQARGLRDDVHFTASVCGRFVLVTNSNQIFVYRLFQTFPDEPSQPNTRVKFSVDRTTSQDPFKTASIYPVTTIICPRRVLDVSMDTSCGRYAVAALLDDRMGLVCELFGSTESSSGRNGFDEV